MSLINDTEEVIHFLKSMGKRQILDSHAVQCRLTACQNLFSVLEEGETHTHYILSNLGDLVGRYKEKNEHVKATTLKVYKSRVKSSLQDFEAWSLNRKVWEKKKQQEIEAAQASAPLPIHSLVTAGKGTKRKKRSLAVAGATEAKRVLSLPLANGRRIEVSLPEDGLTSDELIQLAMALYSYCQPQASAPQPAKLSHLH